MLGFAKFGKPEFLVVGVGRLQADYWRSTGILVRRPLLLGAHFSQALCELGFSTPFGIDEPLLASSFLNSFSHQNVPHPVESPTTQTSCS